MINATQNHSAAADGAKKYLVYELAYAYGSSICTARRFTEEEKKSFSEWFREIGFTGIPGTHHDLDGITHDEAFSLLNLSQRQPDGSFSGCGNVAWIISEEEKQMLLEANEKGLRRKQVESIDAQIKWVESVIARCEAAQAAGSLLTEEEAKAKRIAYNNLYNEGGEGYIPHFFTIEEYAGAKTQLAELQEQRSKLTD